MKLEEFDFYLPDELIAQTPLLKRDTSKLLTINRKENTYEHKVFSDIIDYFNPGDTLVLNNTRVMPARLYGQKKDTGAAIEVLLLKNKEHNMWECLVKPAKRIKVGSIVSFGDGIMEAECVKVLDDGFRYFEFKYEGIFQERLDELGTMPLPPYIKERLTDKERYQTVYAKENGSAAAPTAGLHFTEELMQQIRDKGVNIVPVTLHVGLGTFRPVSVDSLEDHKMHSEYYNVSKETTDMIEATKKAGKRVIAVGTTSIRTLETVARDNDGHVVPASGWTDIFISPGYEFRVVDAFVTNFHLPKSTLVMLVSAYLGREFTLEAYQHAIEERYRFFSFGDAMFVHK